MRPPEWAAAAAAAARLRAPGTAPRVQQERGAQGPLAVRGREVLRAQEVLQEPGVRVARERGELAARAGARAPPPAEPRGAPEPGARELPEAQRGRQASPARLREREGTPVSREAPERPEPQRVPEAPGQRESRERQERQAPEVQEPPEAQEPPEVREPPGSEEPPGREGT